MRACGITAEFNPLHNGHEFLMKEARRITGCDSVVVAMSGNYVQRGEPAIIDKWARTRAALSCGADLVIEIPTVFCLSDAGRYARAGVTLLESLGCTRDICCGSGSGDAETLKKTAALIMEHSDEIKHMISASLPSGMSYPKAREDAVRQLLKNEGFDYPIENVMKNPNDVLALEYILAARSAEVAVVKRAGRGYDEDFDDDALIQSAGGIRSLIKSKGMDAVAEKISVFMPETGIEELKKSHLSYPDEWTEILRYAVTRSKASEIENCPSGGEGLGNLLKKAVCICETWDDIIKYCKSKRYTYTRISRLCTQLILGIRQEYPERKPEYVRILGFNRKGRKLLSYIKKNELNTLPIITNINKETASLCADAAEMLADEARFTDIYNIITKRNVSLCSDHKISAVCIT